VSPSYEVIARGIGLKSKSNIHRIVHRLRTDGHIVTKLINEYQLTVRNMLGNAMAWHWQTQSMNSANAMHRLGIGLALAMQ
jgi:SOS-response transcriptional repressor LexA